MATNRRSIKIPKKMTLNNNAELITKTTTAITQAIARSQLKGNKDEKISIHIHIGDIVMMGFDEAIDAEEWGMRENNTEIIDGKSRSGHKANAGDSNANENKNRKISRTINFRKGAIALNAIENSEPALKNASKKTPSKRIIKSKVGTKRK